MTLGKWAAGLAMLAFTAGLWAQGTGNPPPASSNPPAGQTQNPPPAQANPAPAAAPGDNGTPPLFGGSWEIYGGVGVWYPKATNANQEPISFTNPVGGTGGIRYHIDDWNAVDIRYGYSQSTMLYGTAFTAISRNNEFTMDYALTVPTDGPIRPYVIGGGGVIRFNPTPASVQAQSYESGQTKAALVYGGGLDFPITRHISLRPEYRGIFFRVPDYHLLGIGKWDHIAEPEVLLVFHF